MSTTRHDNAIQVAGRTLIVPPQTNKSLTLFRKRTDQHRRRVEKSLRHLARYLAEFLQLDRQGRKDLESLSPDELVELLRGIAEAFKAQARGE